MNVAALSFRKRIDIHFPRQTYRWFDIRYFKIEFPEVVDEDILMSLLKVPEYCTTYTSPNLIEKILGVPVHGPLRLDRMRPQSFGITTTQDAKILVEEFLSGGDPPASAADLEIDKYLLDAISSADSLYRLVDQPEAHHDESFLLGDFSELILIDRKKMGLTVAAMGYD